MEAPSPSGYEQPAPVRGPRLRVGFADEVRTDVMGNVIASKNGAGTQG